MKILFTGDLFSGGNLGDEGVFGALPRDYFSRFDSVVVNLEQAISDSYEVVDKCTLFTDSSDIPALSTIGVTVATIAHNHIHDCGLGAIIETRNHLLESGIEVVGAGKNLEEARKPALVGDLAILAYCDFGKSYLNDVAVAARDLPGVNPLRLESIMDDLDCLAMGSKAVLCFHWGREHVSCPPSEDLALARKLLEDDRVALIIGNHCHRIQGMVEKNGKMAFISLGNFLFPNFFMSPPFRICNDVDESDQFGKTRLYHQVFRLTYKKWQLINRLSMVVEFDTETSLIKRKFFYQDDESSVLRQLGPLSGNLINLYVNLLSMIYSLPTSVYKMIESISTRYTEFRWRFGIRLFYWREKGGASFLKNLIRKVIR